MSDSIYVFVGLAVAGHLTIIVLAIFWACHNECKKKRTTNQNNDRQIEEETRIEETLVQSDVLVTDSENLVTEQSDRLVRGSPKMGRQAEPTFSTNTWVSSLSNRIQRMISRGRTNSRTGSSLVVAEANLEQRNLPGEVPLPTYNESLSMQLNQQETNQHLRQVSRITFSSLNSGLHSNSGLNSNSGVHSNSGLNSNSGVGSDSVLDSNSGRDSTSEQNHEQSIDAPPSYSDVYDHTSL